jgi:hypothetical protein
MCSSEKWSRLPVSLASISRTPTNPAHTTHWFCLLLKMRNGRILKWVEFGAIQEFVELFLMLEGEKSMYRVFQKILSMKIFLLSCAIKFFTKELNFFTPGSGLHGRAPYLLNYPCIILIFLDITESTFNLGL